MMQRAKRFFQYQYKNLPWFSIYYLFVTTLLPFVLYLLDFFCFGFFIQTRLYWNYGNRMVLLFIMSNHFPTKSWLCYINSTVVQCMLRFLFSFWIRCRISLTISDFSFTEWFITIYFFVTCIFLNMLQEKSWLWYI